MKWQEINEDRARMTVLQIQNVELLRMAMLKVINKNIDLQNFNAKLDRSDQEQSKQRIKSKGDDDFDAIKIENPNNSDSDEYPKRILTIYGVFEHFRWLCLRQIVIANSNIFQILEDDSYAVEFEKSKRWIIHSLASFPRIETNFQN